MQEQSTRPCPTCGGTDRYKNGNCRPCYIRRKRAYEERKRTEAAVLPCKACGAEERDGRGQCAECRRRHMRDWRERHRLNPPPTVSEAEERICSRCKQSKPLTAYFTHRDGVYFWQCRACSNERKKAFSRNQRLTCLTHYSNGTLRCACCREQGLHFLCIDHVNNDGAEHRRSIGGAVGNTFFAWLVRHNFPEGFQVLCYNCNNGKRVHDGVCPHVFIASGI